MTQHRDPSRDDNPLGIGPRDRESSNTGSTADTSYDAVGSDRYPTGEPRRSHDDTAQGEARTDAIPAPDRGAGGGTASRPADPDVPSSDEP